MIPMPIAKTLNIKDKDELEIWMDDSQIIMKKKETSEG